ncbi:MAG: IgGFc-binding protein [Ignavibacteria bacterium]|nr:IgGFc-binding protein [Ignavibacteria bacterium]
MPTFLTSTTNAGTEFYFSFPPCVEEESNSSNSCRVFVASNVKQLVTVRIDGKSWLMTKVVIPNEVVEFVIPYTLAQPFMRRATAKIPEEKIYTGGAVRVSAQAPIIVYGVTRYTYSGDGFLVLPVSALGTDYIVASYPPTGTSNSIQKLSSETTISAAYDSTVVRFKMGGSATSMTSGGLLSGHDTVFIMNKGDVLCFAGNGYLHDLSGSRITSSLPVAVVSGTQCANVPIDMPWCDYLSEMELPTYSWGKEYHVTPILGRKKNSLIRIFAKEPNTTVYRDGVPWLYLPNSSGVIDDGYADRRVDDSVPRPVVITADLPIYVVEYNSGQGEDNIVSDPFQMVLTPFEQYQKEIVFATPGTKTSSFNYTSHYVNLIYELGSATTMPDDVEFATVVKGKFEWNKVSVRFGSTPGMIFSIPVNGKIYACKQLTLPGEGVYSIRANSPIAAYMYGFTAYESYGFPAGVRLYNNLVKDTVAPIVTWTQDCDGSVRNGRVIDYPESTTMRTNLGALYMDSPMDSSYNYSFTYGRNQQFIAGESRETDWSLTVIDPWKKARAILRFIDRNGNASTNDITYTPQKITLSPADFLDFGVIKSGQSVAKKFTLTNETPNDAVITKLELLSETVGFLIDNTQLPFTLRSGESQKSPSLLSNRKLGFIPLKLDWAIAVNLAIQFIVQQKSLAPFSKSMIIISRFVL